MTKITNDILECYAFCRYKSYLKLIGNQGTKSDYEAKFLSLRNEAKIRAINKILSQYKEGQIVKNIPLSTDILKQERLFILETTLEDDRFSLNIDGLKKVAGTSKLGEFHYIPVIFYERQKISKEIRFLLNLYGALLAQYQGVIPSNGIILLGKECKTIRINLHSDTKEVTQAFENLKQICDKPPKLILNNHCQICEFRQPCFDQSVQEDNISLLRRMSEKEIKNYSRKGIFTVTQLAHTFRPRRTGKNSNQKADRHHYALQALAIRDKRIYVLGKPELSQNQVFIYMDIEGNPEEEFVYLIGLVILADGIEKKYSFWANNKEEEIKIFEQFVMEVNRYQGFIIFCYGNYERTFITKMKKIVKRKKPVDKILNNLVNILSLIYAHIYFPTYSNSLKDISRYLGFSWTDPNASGIQSVVWRMQWESTLNDDLKQKLIIYNIEDCLALKKVTELIQIIIFQSNSGDVAKNEDKARPDITILQDVEKLSDFSKWGRVTFVHKDYEYINKCAYFDYQRERVYIRNSKTQSCPI